MKQKITISQDRFIKLTRKCTLAVDDLLWKMVEMEGDDPAIDISAKKLSRAYQSLFKAVFGKEPTDKQLQAMIGE